MKNLRISRRNSIKSGAVLAAMAIKPALARQSAAVPVSIQGVSHSESEQITSLLTSFVQKYSVPGISLAMTYHGQLKLLACAGYSDTTTKQNVGPNHRFRLASVSKPITSITTMLIGQMGHLDLDQPVFRTTLTEFSDIIKTLPTASQKRLHSITTRHLLEHSSGGWGNGGIDPMFAQPAIGVNHQDLIRWTISKQPLKHDPGTHYEYSNFGYCLVGRILERRLKMSYENVVLKYVLDPFGMQDSTLRIGGNTLEERQQNEVTYYGQNEDAYHRIMDVRRMDAHGGWVGTPTDLVRLINRVDGFPTPPDLLQPSWIETMATASAANSGYAKGWSVNKHGNWWHNGSFNGGSSIVARIQDGHCWAMTMNTRSKQSGYNSAIDKLPWNIRRTVKRWGSHDLFPKQS